MDKTQELADRSMEYFLVSLVLLSMWTWTLRKLMQFAVLPGRGTFTPEHGQP